MSAIRDGWIIVLEFTFPVKQTFVKNDSRLKKERGKREPLSGALLFIVLHLFLPIARSSERSQLSSIPFIHCSSRLLLFNTATHRASSLPIISSLRALLSFLLDTSRCSACHYFLSFSFHLVFSTYLFFLLLFSPFYTELLSYMKSREKLLYFIAIKCV